MRPVRMGIIGPLTKADTIKAIGLSLDFVLLRKVNWVPKKPIEPLTRRHVNAGSLIQPGLKAQCNTI